MKGYTLTIALTAAFSYTTQALSFNNGNTDSIKSTTSTIAKSIVSLYPPNSGLLPSPYWWWESGSTLDSLLSYYHTTGDATYNSFVSSSIRNVGCRIRHCNPSRLTHLALARAKRLQ